MKHVVEPVVRKVNVPQKVETTEGIKPFERRSHRGSTPQREETRNVEVSPMKFQPQFVDNKVEGVNILNQK